mgnify:CR=1 FL=1
MRKIKLFSIKSFKVGQNVSGFYLCKDKYIKKTRLGDSYIDLILQDSTGKIRAKIWSHAKHFSNNFMKNDIVAVKGSIIEFNHENELNIKSINAITDDFYLEYGYSNSLILGSDTVSIKKNKKYILDKIRSLPIKYSKFLIQIYNLNNSKIGKIPIDKESFFLKGGLLKYTSLLLKMHHTISNYYHDIDNDRISICILLMNIGYIDYYNDDLFTISENGREFNVDILGINLLSKILNNYNQIDDDDKNFFKQCVLLNSAKYDKNIHFVKHLISLGNISSDE